MRAGALRHRLEIQSVTISQDSTGQPTESWSTDSTVWGAVEPLEGREYWEAAQTNAENNVRIRLRYGTTVTPADRIKWGSRYFDIRSVLSRREKNEELILMCVEDQ